jgi:hypothetical protein
MAAGIKREEEKEKKKPRKPLCPSLHHSLLCKTERKISN